LNINLSVLLLIIVRTVQRSRTEALYIKYIGILTGTGVLYQSVYRVA